MKKKSKYPQSYTPIFFIGYGSTGLGTINKIRSFLFDKYGSPYPPGIKYLAIASDENSQINNSKLPPLQKDEIITTNRIKDSKDFFKSDSFFLNDHIEYGFRSSPSFGNTLLTSLFNDDNSSNLISLMSDFNNDNLKFASMLDTKTPRIISVASLVGGTGFLSGDVTRLINNKFTNFDFDPYILRPFYSPTIKNQNQLEESLNRDWSPYSIFKNGHIIEIQNSDYRKVGNKGMQEDVINSIFNYIISELNFIYEKQFNDPNLWLFQNILNDIQKIKVKIDLEIVNNEVLRFLKKNPEKFQELTPRNFEIIVASIWKNLGYNVEMTKSTRDGGKDFYAAIHDITGTQLLYGIECKKYDVNKPVGVVELRKLYGVVQNERLTVGTLVTTSFFTKDAREFQKMNKNQIGLKDYEDLKKMVSNVFEKSKIITK
jgi:HJR/Mrr/RecB family endonuclease